MLAVPDPALSPFRRPDAAPLDPAKFRDPVLTAKGERRAIVPLSGLTTLWFNTGTLCNLACATCYIGSSPTNDALVYLSAVEVTAYLDEVAQDRLPVREIGLTGGEPFMNREIIDILGLCLGRGFETLVLTNAMRPMRRFETALLRLRDEHSDRLTLRVSLDHYSQAVHEAERGAGTWTKALDGLQWLARNSFSIAVAGRVLPGESEAEGRAGYQSLFDKLGLSVSAADPARLVLFPEMDSGAGHPRDQRGLLVDPGQVTGERDVREQPDGGEAQGRGAAAGRRLHFASLRKRVRHGRDARGGEPTGRAQPPALRALLRPGRR
jgi:uncharacterized Fe-S cluster-containing radical SAM superfamily protein